MSRDCDKYNDVELNNMTVEKDKSSVTEVTGKNEKNFILEEKPRKKDVTEENEKIEENKAQVDLDTILINEVGQFGWFQLRVLALAALAALFSASNGEYVFTTARINTRCLVPQCENASSAAFAASWLVDALPSSEHGVDSCKRFSVHNITYEYGVFNDSCPAEIFDRNTTRPCEEHVYENTQTVVYDFDLACDEWRRSFIGFSRTLGTFFALPLTGFVSDRWGRSTALALNTFNSAWIGLCRYWANSYTSFMALEIIESVFGAGVFSCSYILVLEIVGSKYRVIAGGILTSCFALGQVSLGLVAWAISSWRQFTLAIYIPQLITISYFWILAESVRWYLSKGRYEEAEKLLKEAARINKRELSEMSLHSLRVSAEEDKQKKAIEKAEKAQEPWLPILVFRHRTILIRCMVSPVWWITTTLVYYGLSINSVNISGNKYMDYVAVAAVEIPGFWLSVFLLSRVGRKPVLSGAFWMCAACQAAYVFMPSSNYVLSLTVYLIGKCSIAVVVTAIYVYTTELYPTRYRHNLFAFSSMIGRIGSITAPLTPAMGDATFNELPFVLFGVLALVSGALVQLTPETRGCTLPDTMEQAEDMHRMRRDA